MDESKKYQVLYRRYKELLEKTSIKAHNVTEYGKIDVNDISLKDLEERLKIEKQLSEGFKFLSDNQLLDLAGDAVFSEQAQNILIKRKEVQ